MTHNPPRMIQFYRWMWRFWKERRFVKFVETIQPSSNDILLDTGGYPFNWYRRGGLVKRVDTLNLTLQPMDLMPDEALKYAHFKAMRDI